MVASLFSIESHSYEVHMQSFHTRHTIDCLSENEHLSLIRQTDIHEARRIKDRIPTFYYPTHPYSLFESTTHKALFSEVTCHTISSDWCHERCQEESIDSAGFSIFNGVNGHLLSSDATAALFQMEAHVTPRLIMPATSREARALCP